MDPFFLKRKVCIANVISACVRPKLMTAHTLKKFCDCPFKSCDTYIYAYILRPSK
jgi:hypothetical protein